MTYLSSDPKDFMDMEMLLPICLVECTLVA